jgi:hypothetical protein
MTIGKSEIISFAVGAAAGSYVMYNKLFQWLAKLAAKATVDEKKNKEHKKPT